MEEQRKRGQEFLKLSSMTSSLSSQYGVQKYQVIKLNQKLNRKIGYLKILFGH